LVIELTTVGEGMALEREANMALESKSQAVT
jgi:hypothetical protein